MARYACADLHGYYDIYEKINEFLQPNDTVEFLGDAIDRGPESYKLMKAIFNNPQWKYYRGNHEIMLYDSLKQYIVSCDEYNMGYMRSLSNGASYRGRPAVFEILLQEGEEEMQRWIDNIENNTYLFGVFTNNKGYTLHLSHAGTNIPIFTTIKDERKLLWDREHIYENLSPRYRKNIIIHGHTPISYLHDLINGQKIGTCKDDGLNFYQTRKLDIDAGVFYTGMVYLINLDTLTPDHIDYQIFKTQEDLYGER